MECGTIHPKPNGERPRVHQFVQTMTMQYCDRGCDYAGQLDYLVPVDGCGSWALFIRGLLATAKFMGYARYELLH